MKAAAFAYHRPDTVAEAVQMLGEFGEDAKILAGGQSLVPMLAMRLTYFENIIDISRIDELKNIELRDDELWIAAGTPHALVGMDDEVADSVPLLTLSTPYIGHFQIRTRGTLGGAIAHADPAAEYAAVALALDATMEATSSRGRREIPAAEFFTGLWETSLAPDEILTAVRFPVWGGRSGFAVEEFARRHGDFAIAGATVAVELDSDDRVAGAESDCSASVRRRCEASVAEDAVVGQPAGAVAAEEVGRLAMSGLSDIPADLQGSADYRSRVGAAMVARAWSAAVREAETSSTEAIHA